MVTKEKRYYISSLIESAREFGERVRSHWSVESTLHWTLDVTFKEDDSRANVLHSAANLGAIRRAAINVVKSDPELKKWEWPKSEGKQNGIQIIALLKKSSTLFF